MRGIPASRATGSAGTSGAAIALPASAATVKIKCSGDAYIGVGATASPIPGAATGNSVYLDSGATEYLTVASAGRQDVTHLYVYAASGTVTYYVSFYRG